MAKNEEKKQNLRKSKRPVFAEIFLLGTTKRIIWPKLHGQISQIRSPGFANGFQIPVTQLKWCNFFKNVAYFLTNFDTLGKWKVGRICYLIPSHWSLFQVSWSYTPATSSIQVPSHLSILIVLISS